MVQIPKLWGPKTIDIQADIYGDTSHNHRFDFATWQIYDGRRLILDIARRDIDETTACVEIDLLDDTLTPKRSVFEDFAYVYYVSSEEYTAFIQGDGFVSGDPGKYRLRSYAAQAAYVEDFYLCDIETKTGQYVKLSPLKSYPSRAYLRSIFFMGIQNAGDALDIHELMDKVLVVGSRSNGSNKDGLLFSLLTHNPSVTDPTSDSYFYRDSNSNLYVDYANFSIYSVKGAFLISPTKFAVIGGRNSILNMFIFEVDLNNWPATPSLINTIPFTDSIGDSVYQRCFYNNKILYVYNSTSGYWAFNQAWLDESGEFYAYYNGVDEFFDKNTSKLNLSKFSSQINSDDVIEVVFTPKNGYADLLKTGTATIEIKDVPGTPDNTWGALSASSSGPFFDGSGIPVQTSVQVPVDGVTGEAKVYYKTPRSGSTTKQETLLAKWDS